ncbi:MAG TPA: hypothetical protein VEX64_00905 [Pyrinomonadaceae bacterium]|jgi:hypothetical protein|nr:hypothetical protein [Pyrinomonadaceae bacterium]
MLKKLYLAFGLGVILLYTTSAWLGWEFLNDGSRRGGGSPFIFFGRGFRGGK